MIGILGDRNGFQHMGGIQTLFRLLCRRLKATGYSYRIITADQGQTRDCSHIFVLGCSSPWAYRKVLRLRILQPSLKVHWIPCFHPPHIVANQTKSLVAGRALRNLQSLGVHLHALTEAECMILNRQRCSVISLPFDCEQEFLRRSATQSHVPGSLQDRPYELLFLGRPVAQKGWPQFHSMVSQLKRPCLALVPFKPEGDSPPNLEILINAVDDQIPEMLGKAKVLMLPADYESFGFAQAEALLSGCVVPVLGEWPLWLGVEELDWRLLNPTEWLERLAILLQNPDLLVERQHQQKRCWLARPERQAPALPALYV